MGNTCCIAATDKTIVNGPSSEAMHRNIRHSPTWSFRWDNRGRVAGEETSINWFSDRASQNSGSHTKYESTYASEDGSPMDNFRRGSWQKSPLSEGAAGHVKTPASDQSISTNISMDVNLEQVKESVELESPVPSHPSPTKPSLPLPSTSSFSSSPLSFQSHQLPSSPNPSRWAHRSPGHRPSQQLSDNQGTKSPGSDSISEERPVLPPWSNESTRASRGGSSDGWSMNAFSELMARSRRERWSFDSESFGLNHDKLTRSSSRISSSPSVDLQTCGVCSKYLTEKSSWSSQKIFAGNELAVVAVLICGHAYHAECLEHMTSEVNKYDPACPVCTLGEKQTLKLCEKALRAEMDLKARNNKRSRNRIVDRDVNGDSVEYVRYSGHEYKGTKMASSSSMKSSMGKPPFLKRHFSFGSKGRSLSENNSTKKKSFFWAKSSKE